MTQDSQQYRDKKQFFENMLTVYGRKPVLEALKTPGVKAFRLHLANTNKNALIIDEIKGYADKSGAEVVYHDRQSLSRISRNSKQDQGVAADLLCEGYKDFRDFLKNPSNSDIIALDRITNPQNLGMIIRSVCAAGKTLLLPKKGCAKLDALVIKASAGTLFRAQILRCDDLTTALTSFAKNDYKIVALSSYADQQLSDISDTKPNVFVLGNETDGVSDAVNNLCDSAVKIDMCNGVESLNVAVTASLLAFRNRL